MSAPFSRSTLQFFFGGGGGISLEQLLRTSNKENMEFFNHMTLGTMKPQRNSKLASFRGKSWKIQVVDDWIGIFPGQNDQWIRTEYKGLTYMQISHGTPTGLYILLYV